MATGYSSSATAVTTLAAFYKKTNTTVKTGIKLVTEEVKWFRDYPREQIEVSGNENRVPLILVQPTGVAAIGDGGNEAIMSTPAPTSGTFNPIQINKRYGFTGLAQALDARSRSSMIENQTQQQAMLAIAAIGRTLGLMTYGQSTGTVAIVRTTNGASATQILDLKDAYGSSTLCPGTGTEQLTYLSSLIRAGEHIALVRGSTIIEFGTVTASPSATSGVGFIDVTFTASCTPTAADKVVFANADGDSTITGTDVNNWMIGFTEALLASSVLGVTTASYPLWAAGSTASASQRLTFGVKEKLINDCMNASGVLPNRFIVSQGVRRDAISGQLGSRRYDSAETDIEGDMKPGAGQKNFTSQLAIPGTLIGWNDRAYSKIELSDLPDEGASKSIFKLDKVQGKSQIAASFDYFAQRIPTSRAAMGYATNLTSA